MEYYQFNVKLKKIDSTFSGSQNRAGSNLKSSEVN